MRRLIDLTGQKFGRLTVIERSNIKKHRTTAVWKCQCDCGKIVHVRSDSLRGENGTESCGCLSAMLSSKRVAVIHTIEAKSKAIKGHHNLIKANKNNIIGTRNVTYIPTNAYAKYNVSIIREGKKYRQSFPTLKQAERAKEYVLSRYKKCIPNWNDKL
ncbi:hypothetical protein RZO31_07650 [Lactococcus lactis]|uniref:AP2 domain-containing protein n=1 Tax=Lactococcus lactis TaxID=1358 RepID=A0AAE4T1G4_9LACT|nr:hypothetical protein [Lactococcus lactis]MDV2632750.1 hypothetical protein [Lactococcus lactis]